MGRELALTEQVGAVGGDGVDCCSGGGFVPDVSSSSPGGWVLISDSEVELLSVLGRVSSLVRRELS